MPYSEEYRELFTQQINLLTQDSNSSEEFIIENLSAFFSLLENGNYKIDFENPRKKIIDGDPWEWELIYETLRPMNDIAEGFYDANFESFIFTEKYATINRGRVDHYKNHIRAGKRPFALILGGKLEESGVHPDNSRWMSTTTTENYILDGHHKLIAYKELGIQPSLLRITKIYNSSHQLDFLLTHIDMLKDWLSADQLKHIQENI